MISITQDKGEWQIEITNEKWLGEISEDSEAIRNALQNNKIIYFISYHPDGGLYYTINREYVHFEKFGDFSATLNALLILKREYGNINARK